MGSSQIWSIIITFIGTATGGEIVKWLVGRGKFRGDEAARWRAELREDNRQQDEEIKQLKQEIAELKRIIDQFRLHRIDMYRVLQENNVSREVLAQLRILEAS